MNWFWHRHLNPIRLEIIWAYQLATTNIEVGYCYDYGIIMMDEPYDSAGSTDTNVKSLVRMVDFPYSSHWGLKKL